MPGSEQSKEIIFKIRKAVAFVDKFSEEILKSKHGFGLSQFLVMQILADQPKVPQKHVAKRLDQTQAAVSRQVDLLDDLGYVSREKNKDSRREYVLSLTKAGEKKFKQASSELESKIEKIFTGWDKNDKNDFIGMLEQIISETKARD